MPKTTIYTIQISTQFRILLDPRRKQSLPEYTAVVYV